MSDFQNNDPHTRDLTVYLVGGAVRDAMLGREVKDRDWVVVGATPEQMTTRGYIAVGRGFPVFLHPESKEEYALARTERKMAKGYRGFEVWSDPSITLEQDLMRRDLTINAMAKDAAGNLIDPFGGESDLQNRVLRHVSPAFAEDPLRVLRTARFLSRFGEIGFSVADSTLELMHDIVDADEIEALPAERVWQELHGALSEPRPDLFISMLRETGALKRILPEIDCLFGIPQTERFHPEVDTGLHVIMVLRMAATLDPRAIVRFAALLHDVGKGITPHDILPAHRGHETSGVPLVKAICDRLKTPRHFRDLAVKVCRLHLNMHRLRELRASTILKMLIELDGFRNPETVRLFSICCEADARGRGGAEKLDYLEADLLLKFLDAARGVDISDLTSSGAPPDLISSTLKQRRIEAIAAMKGTGDL